MLWRRELEEQAELQQALEFQSQKLMSLQLFDVKKHHQQQALYTGSPIPSPTQSSNLFNQTFVLPSMSSSPGFQEGNSLLHTTALWFKFMQGIFTLHDLSQRMALVLLQQYMRLAIVCQSTWLSLPAVETMLLPMIRMMLTSKAPIPKMVTCLNGTQMELHSEIFHFVNWDFAFFPPWIPSSLVCH